MAIEAPIFDSPAPKIYSPDDVLPLENPIVVNVRKDILVIASQALFVKLGTVVDSKEFLLPYVRPPGKSNAPVLIPWYNPDYTKNLELALASAQELSHQISPDTKVVVGPASSKSNWLLQRAVELANERYEKVDDDKIQFIKLAGGYNRRKVREEIGKHGLMNDSGYVPVTATEDSPKYMGISYNDAMTIQQLCLDGNGLMLLDDVYSMGSTMQAMQELMYSVIDGQGYIIDIANMQDKDMFPAAVVMRELEMEGDDPAPAPPTWLRRVFDAPVLFTGDDSVVKAA